jgi:hypothetical protein
MPRKAKRERINRSPEWVTFHTATIDALKDLRHACELIGVMYRQIDGWNKTNGDAVGKLGNANLALTRDFIVSAGMTLKKAQSDLESDRGNVAAASHEHRVFPGIIPIEGKLSKAV